LIEGTSTTALLMAETAIFSPLPRVQGRGEERCSASRLLRPPPRRARMWEDLTFLLPAGDSRMAEEGSVSRWLGPLQPGDPAAAQRLGERYFLSLVQLARQRLRQTPPRGADAEDVALSAFDSFFRNAEQGCFPELHDRNNLWRVLAVITARKAARLLRDEGRQ